MYLLAGVRGPAGLVDGVRGVVRARVARGLEAGLNGVVRGFFGGVEVFLIGVREVRGAGDGLISGSLAAVLFEVSLTGVSEGRVEGVVFLRML